MRALIDEATAAKRLGLSPRTLKRWRRDGGGLEYVRVGLRRIAYAEEALDSFIAARTHPHRASELARLNIEERETKPRE